jgi:hypothetical protein
MRAALVLALGVLAGVGAGVLTALSQTGAAESVIVGTAACAGAVAFFNAVIDER